MQRGKDLVRTVKDLNETISLTGEFDIGTKKKKVKNNHHLTYSCVFNWYIVLMVLS